MIKAKSEGSTILEIVVALVVIMVVMMLSLRIYLQTVQSSASIRHLKAEATLERLEWECRDKQQLVSSEWMDEDFQIQREVTRYSEPHRLWKVKLIASEESGKLLAERVFLVAEK